MILSVHMTSLNISRSDSSLPRLWNTPCVQPNPPIIRPFEMLSTFILRHRKHTSWGSRAVKTGSRWAHCWVVKARNRVRWLLLLPVSKSDTRRAVIVKCGEVAARFYCAKNAGKDSIKILRIIFFVGNNKGHIVTNNPCQHRLCHLHRRCGSRSRTRSLYYSTAILRWCDVVIL